MTDLPQLGTQAARRLLPGWRALRPYLAAAGLISIAGIAVAAPPAGTARSPQPRAWSVPPSKATLLASYFEIVDANCRPLMAPTVRILSRPELGALTVSTGIGQADNPPKCANIQVPVTQIYYQAGNQLGQDNFSWEVRFQSQNLGTQRVQGAVAITPGAR
ncbi:hypothetical protein [Bordetella sp. N]|uniref:hypothetical protein n=1 Tax=Bordetella sp. N TaxID=1746199 RepID=UPI00070D681E|nr:hypothetical protein [Bordetella sp. N]ALM82187.1 hypothetical protein ASB57_03735 [Bordetella sp. N]